MTDANTVSRSLATLGPLGWVPAEGYTDKAEEGTRARPSFALSHNRTLRFGCIGDSLQGGPSDRRFRIVSTRDVCMAIVMRSNGVLTMGWNGTVGGQTSALVAARCRDLARQRCDAGLWMSGTNDNGTLHSAAYIEDSISESHHYFMSRGILMFYGSMLPSNAVAFPKPLHAQLNALIAATCSTLKAQFVNFWDYLFDPLTGGCIVNKLQDDGTHWHPRSIWEIGSVVAWNAIRPHIEERYLAYTPRAYSQVSNLLFNGISNAGVPTAATVDPLFINTRSVTSGTITAPTLPYLFDTMSVVGAPAVTVDAVTRDGFEGQALRIVYPPPGIAASFTLSNGTALRSIPCERFQGRRVRITLKLENVGYDVDNTDAWLAANNSRAQSGIGFLLAVLTRAGTTINNTHVLDAQDPSATLGLASSLGLDYQTTIMANVDAGLATIENAHWCIDHAPTIVPMEINVPVTGDHLRLFVLLRSLATAVGTVTSYIGEVSIEPIGDSEFDQRAMPIGNPEVPIRTLTITTSATITTDEACTQPVIPINATSGAIAPVLPSAGSMLGRRITLVRTDAIIANTITITRAGSDTIGYAAATTYLLAAQDNSVTLQAVVGNWVIVASN